MTTDQHTKTAEERIVEPARAWRNWWRATDGFRHVAYKRYVWPGEVVPGTFVYPSKDVAQSAALETQAMNIRKYGACLIRYLGAFPEGQRPE